MMALNFRAGTGFKDSTMHLADPGRCEFSVASGLTAHAANGTPEHESRSKHERFPSPRPSSSGMRGIQGIAARCFHGNIE